MSKRHETFEMVSLSSRPWEACAFCSAINEEELEDYMRVNMGFDARAKHEDPLVWKYTGRRADGFEKYIKRSLFHVPMAVLMSS